MVACQELIYLRISTSTRMARDGGALSCFLTPALFLRRRRRTFSFFSSLVQTVQMLFKLSLCLLTLVARSTLTSALNITVSSQPEAPGPILIQLATDPTDPPPGAPRLFNLSNSVNTSFPPLTLGAVAINTHVISSFPPNFNFTGNLPPLPESDGWVITAWIFDDTTGSGGTGPVPAQLQNDPETIIGTSNTFSVTPGPQPKSTDAAIVSPRKSFPVGAIVGLSIGGAVLVAAIAGLTIIWRRRRSARRSPSNVEDGRLRGPAPWASTGSLDSLPEKAPWVESGRTV
ncbi:hypothetical protein B0H11DRAFT_767721 [Mycena galericulata]|nr:hypothetical protein B0H11DRAFT_767721 [Mycena galericulata]